MAAADVAGGRLIVVDAIDEAAAAFHARHDFRSVRGDTPPAYPCRMVMKIATARRALGVPGPPSVEFSVQVVGPALRSVATVGGMAVVRVQPIKHDPVLDEYAGQWVAVKDGQVVAHSVDSRDVVRQLRGREDNGRGAVVQRVATMAEPLAVGLG